MTNQTQPTTAEHQYNDHQIAILALIDDLRDELAQHSRNFDRTGRTHWGYPGDLAHIRETLQDACNFLTNNE